VPCRISRNEIPEPPSSLVSGSLTTPRTIGHVYRENSATGVISFRRVCPVTATTNQHELTICKAGAAGDDVYQRDTRSNNEDGLCGDGEHDPNATRTTSENRDGTTATPPKRATSPARGYVPAKT
jgi:hypothetical protein